MEILRQDGTRRWRVVSSVAMALATILPAILIFARVQDPPEPGCRVESVGFEGWQAQQLSNFSVKLVIDPQLGGCVMQVCSDDHPYLFVNPKYKGQYYPWKMMSAMPYAISGMQYVAIASGSDIFSFALP
jgi:hypothetical protein